MCAEGLAEHLVQWPEVFGVLGVAAGPVQAPSCAAEAAEASWASALARLAVGLGVPAVAAVELPAAFLVAFLVASLVVPTGLVACLA